MMIGGGGNNCKNADHGIGIIEDVEPGPAKEDHYDFGYGSDYNQPSTYSLNLWVQ
jgi:hypothetical protein